MDHGREVRRDVRRLRIETNTLLTELEAYPEYRSTVMLPGATRPRCAEGSRCGLGRCVSSRASRIPCTNEQVFSYPRL